MRGRVSVNRQGQKSRNRATWQSLRLAIGAASQHADMRQRVEQVGETPVIDGRLAGQG
jgi:hypothetical protein